MLLDSGAHPVDFGVSGDGLVVGIDHDHLEVLVGRILTHPVRVQHTKTLESTADALLKSHEMLISLLIKIYTLSFYRSVSD